MLMGSFNSSHLQQKQQEQQPQQQQGEEEEDHHDQAHHQPNISSDLQVYHQRPLMSTRGLTLTTTPPPIAATTHMRQLLITCAELISQLDFSSAHHLISVLSANSSPYGDSTERLVHQFVRALSLRLNQSRGGGTAMAMAMAAVTTIAVTAATTSSSLELEEEDSEEAALQSCYLTLNQITPFIRFSHLTANQAILEAIDEAHQSIHILDFDIMHGVQWPPLMQALAERSYNTIHPPPMLRITATGRDLTLLHRTGERLRRFAHSLGLRFQFHPLLLNDVALDINPSSLGLLPDEALAVNCVLYLHKLITDDSRDLKLFLEKIKALNPTIVTVAEREANHNHPVFLQRFVEAVDHYAAVFDSLEATLPPNSRERLAVEQVWFGREIADVAAAVGEGDNRSSSSSRRRRRRQLRHERYEAYWEVMLRRSGFSNVPLSPFALSQAKLLLRLHYPSEGYQLHILKDSTFFLGWQNRPLFSVSSWS